MEEVERKEEEDRLRERKAQVERQAVRKESAKMPRAKEEVMSYADDVYLMWLRNHIDYIESVLEHLKGIYSVYEEIKQESKSDYGWIPAPEFIEIVNKLKMYLDKFFMELIQHQKTIISGKLLWNEIKNEYQKQAKKSKKEEKKEEIDPSIR